jgi:rod shape determining protein RodA
MRSAVRFAQPLSLEKGRQTGSRAANMGMRTLVRDLDWVLLGAVAAVLLIGLLTLYSASRHSGSGIAANCCVRQLMWVFIALCFMWGAMVIDYHRFLAFAPVIYVAVLLGLVVVLFVPSRGHSARRWLALGPLQVQPSELCKIAVVLLLARYLDTVKIKIRHPRFFITAMVLVALPVILIMVEPDLGTAMVFIPVLLVMLYLAGSKTKHIVSICVLGLASTPVLWRFLRGYQRMRLVAFIKPEVDPLGWGYQTIQSTIAVGSGKFLGKGWLRGTQSRLNFLPAQHTDFVFSVYSEEWGFVGAVILLGLLSLIVARSMRIALQARDFSGNILAAGLVTMLACHFLINVAVVLGLMPVTGLPLPLMSYGGSSLVSTMTLIGLVLNVRVGSRVF